MSYFLFSILKYFFNKKGCFLFSIFIILKNLGIPKNLETFIYNENKSIINNSLGIPKYYCFLKILIMLFISLDIMI